MARYHTILFDADQTLLDFLQAERAALCEALCSVGVTPDEAMIRKYSEINSATWKRLERGEISKAALRTERFVTFCAYYGFAVDVDALSARYLESLATQRFLLPGALEVCSRLARACRLYIITNGIASVQHGRFDPSPLRPFFEGCFISDEVGAEKPDPLFFDRVAAAIPDFDPSDTLVIGDSLTSDMAGGIRAGLDTCWFNPAGKTAPDGMPITYTVRKLEDIVPLVLGA